MSARGQFGIKRLDDMDDAELRHMVGQIREELARIEAGEVSPVEAELIGPPNGS